MKLNHQEYRQLDLIRKRVEDELQLEPGTLHMVCRRHELVDSRNIAIYFQRKCTGYTLTKIGEYWKKDHSTIINSLNKVDDLQFTDTTYRRLLSRFCKIFDTIPVFHIDITAQAEMYKIQSAWK